MQTSQQQTFVWILLLGWIVFGYLAIRPLFQWIKREMRQENNLVFSASFSLTNIMFLLLEGYGFFLTTLKPIFLQLLHSEYSFITIPLVFVFLFGGMGLFGFLMGRFAKLYFRYGITFMLLYIFAAFCIAKITLFKELDLKNLGLQLWMIYIGFLGMMFPFEMGDIVRKIVIDKKNTGRKAS